MPDKTVTIPEPNETATGVHFEIHTGPPLRVTVAYRGDAKTWEGDDVPAPLRALISPLLRSAVFAAKKEWGY